MVLAIRPVTTKYSDREIDLFAIYRGDLDRVFLVLAALGVDRKELWLRLPPARNSQQACINLADQYDFNGAVAQLGERRAGSAKVRGSSPLSSTPLPPTTERTRAINRPV